MDRRPADLHPSLENRFMDTLPIIPFSSERGEQGGMYVDDAIPMRIHKRCREDGQKACEHDQVNRMLAQQVFERLLKGFSPQRLAIEADGRDSLHPAAPKGLRIGLVAGNQHHLTGKQISVQKRLEVGAASACQYRNTYHSSTRGSSLASTEPST
ncbi:hypothetical protein SDC9_192698 [bioreactor metagenome]|jgi:hypothetical protein|uniref:Uncharacterized protein n=1 Tax=bioreactor metagenome TaxID=1076179 RepID=A0A645I1G3_9ZZZZ